jgi:hypothetical protein
LNFFTAEFGHFCSQIFPKICDQKVIKFCSQKNIKKLPFGGYIETPKKVSFVCKTNCFKFLAQVKKFMESKK